MTKKSLPVETPLSEYDYEKNPPIGIDLGTSNSAIARWANTFKFRKSLVYNLNDQDGYLMPSALYLQEYEGKKEFIIGKQAYKRRLLEPENIVYSIKRTIGDSSQSIRLGNSLFSSVELSAEILKALFRSVSSVGLSLPAGIVVSVPYYFTQNQNHNTKKALEKAIGEFYNSSEFGSDKAPKILGLIPEPIAAALSYSLEHMDIPIDLVILAMDFGGGTLDATIFSLRITGASIEFEVLATEGDSQFGGDDFDHILEEYIVEQENISYSGLNKKEVKLQKQMIREAAKEAKEKLSYQKRFDLVLPNLPCSKSIDSTIKRNDFEGLLVGRNSMKRNFYGEFEEILNRIIVKARISHSSITTILSIGGSTKIPFFKQIIKNNFPHASHPVPGDSEHDELFLSVAKGAAIYAAYLLDKDHGATHLPFYKEIKLTTRTSHNLGIKQFNNKFNVLVPENTIVPTSYDKLFVPVKYADKERELVEIPEIELYQGRNDMVIHNTLIGKIRLPEIYAHNRKLDDIKIHIKFEVDVTTLNVSIHIPNSDKNKRNIEIYESINLEEKQT